MIWKFIYIIYIMVVCLIFCVLWWTRREVDEGLRKDEFEIPARTVRAFLSFLSGPPFWADWIC